VLRGLVFLAALAVVGVMAWGLRFLVAPVVLAFLISYGLTPFVNLVEDWGVPRTVAVVGAFAVLGGLLVGVGLSVWPDVDTWLQETTPPGQKSELEVQLAHRSAAWERALLRAYPHIDWHGALERAWRFVEDQRRELVETLPALALRVLSNVGTALLAPVMALFFLLDGARMKREVVRWVPNRHFELVVLLLHRVDRQLSGYLRGAMTDALVVSTLASVTLYVLGMPNAVLLGVVFGVVNVIPMAGVVIGSSVGIIYALLLPDGPPVGHLVLCYACVYALDAAFINPTVVGRSVNVHPLTILVGIAVGANLGGILGMLLIIPVIAVGKVVAVTVAESLKPAT
jgi:predicted PurR-regulated permease PerM